MLSILFLAVFASNALALSLPSLLGDNLVGTVSFELVDISRSDAFNPVPNSSRDLMVSVFYPVQNVGRCDLAPAYPPLYAAYLDKSLGLKPGTAGTVISQAYASAHLQTSDETQPNIILFSPSTSHSRTDYTAAMSNLASNGYIVIGVDHPFDSSFIEYPDGRTAVKVDEIIQGYPPDEDNSFEPDVRAGDLIFILDSLSQNATLARQIPGVNGKLDMSRVGVFGHDMGGGAAAEAMFFDPRFICGANLDGIIEGSVELFGTPNPFLLFNTETHNRTSEPSWAAIWALLRGFKLELTVLGSTHDSFSDQAALYEELLAKKLISNRGNFYGTIGGKTMLGIENAYLTAFFDMCLKGKKELLLNGPNSKFSAVKFWSN